MDIYEALYTTRTMRRIVNGQVEVSAGGQMKVSSPCGNS
ncbi:hypothetical protein L842_4180 [Mycobacterium intracellulare MIN_052511_1280]|nr:hypothetical protein L842_4180 [Mycobacterium intracellulare MIN_052511_1280]